jgi:lipopolysaccharide/colanic/teichoic acid biosynthesis glycosyltransferase
LNASKSATLIRQDRWYVEDALAPGELDRLSPWSTSTAKRAVDVCIVAVSLPIVLPIMLFIAIAIRISSRGPALFFQQRIGRDGRPFIIWKFRTMTTAVADHAIAALHSRRVTAVGRFLRRSKLDELPQIVNVLLGDMSLVGPRPLIADQQLRIFSCRPGMTGAATLAFVREEALLAAIPKAEVALYYRRVVLPRKHQVDADYMSNATFASDLGIIVRSMLRCWLSPGRIPPLKH